MLTQTPFRQDGSKTFSRTCGEVSPLLMWPHYKTGEGTVRLVKTTALCRHSPLTVVATLTYQQFSSLKTKVKGDTAAAHAANSHTKTAYSMKLKHSLQQFSPLQVFLQ